MKLNISEATMDMIRKRTLPGHTFKQTAARLPDGRWEWEPQQEVLDLLNVQRLPGESDDDAIARILLAAAGRKPN